MPFIDPRLLETVEPRDGWKGQFFHSRTMTFAYYSADAGAWIHEHRHPNDEVWHIVEGQLAITIAGETTVAGPGTAAVVPPNTRHAVKALTAARAIVVDHPRRMAIGGIDLRPAPAATRRTSRRSARASSSPRRRGAKRR